MDAAYSMTDVFFCWVPNAWVIVIEIFLINLSCNKNNMKKERWNKKNYKLLAWSVSASAKGARRATITHANTTIFFLNFEREG